MSNIIKIDLKDLQAPKMCLIMRQPMFPVSAIVTGSYRAPILSWSVEWTYGWMGM